MRISAGFRTKVLVVIAALMLTINIGAQSRRDRDQARSLQEQADKAYIAKNYREAAEKYGQAIALVPTNPYSYYRKGFAHFNLKENEEAIKALSAALTQGYRPLDVYRIRHFIHFDQKNYDEALADIEKGLQLAPNDLNFLAARGEIFLVKRSYPEAIEIFQNIVKLNPNSADTFYNLARVYQATGDAERQAEAAESALAKGTKFPGESFFLLGEAHQRLKNYSKAIDAYQKSLNAKPDVYQTYTNLSVIFREENRLSDAINILKRGLQAFPLDGGFFTELGWLYSLADRPDEAVEAARAGVTIKPNESTPYTNLCRAYNETKKYDLAIGACNSALRIKPGDGETHFYLGRAFDLSRRPAEATKNYALAVKGLEETTARTPDKYDAWYLLGNAYFADNQRDKAVEAYMKSLELSPKFTKAHYNLGVIYTLKKDRSAANGQYEKLLPLDPKLAEALKIEIGKI